MAKKTTNNKADKRINTPLSKEEIDAQKNADLKESGDLVEQDDEGTVNPENEGTLHVENTDEPSEEEKLMMSLREKVQDTFDVYKEVEHLLATADGTPFLPKDLSYAKAHANNIKSKIYKIKR